MTREDAISIMNVIVHMLEPQYDTDRIEDAVEIAIKALEKEPILDKIKAEIREFSVVDESGTYRISTYLVDQIIDKYRGE